MRLFPRLFLGHLVVVLVALLALFTVAELLAPSFYRHHVEQMAALIGPEGRALRPDLERGMRSTLSSSLLASIPFAVLVALGTAFATSRRIVRSVRLLSEGSRALANGQYDRRLPEGGRDELAELARNFNRMASALERVEQDRVALIGDVGHELRTPLAALRGYTEALSDGVMTPEQVSPAIRREVRAMERLASDLSLVSKVEARRVEMHFTTFAPADLIAGVVERFGSAFEERDVTLEVGRVDAALVRADFERSLQVLSNLLSNALRYTPPGGRVEVRAEVSGAGLVAFHVRDSGSGIPEAHLAHIFERFYRVDPARTRREGSGVGLTIARGLAEQMNGTLQVTSGPGGSTFTFTLPGA